MISKPIEPQSVVLDTLSSVDLSVPGSPSLIMRDLSEYATLPFIAAFDVKPYSEVQTPQKRVTYIGISKKTMPMLVELFERFKSSPEIYVDGTLETILAVRRYKISSFIFHADLRRQAYSIPMKLKYDCPVPSKSGKDLPLWKTATQCFLKCVALATPNLKQMDEGVILSSHIFFVSMIEYYL